jgi:hypothetical protein
MSARFDDDRFDDDDDEFDDFFGYDDDDWEPRPDWLHPDCRSVCLALELGTCCRYPDNPLVRVAADLADAVCAAPAGAELTRQSRLVPGLLAQVHAILPRLTARALAQLRCPVGLLAGALDDARERGRPELAPVAELVAECAAAIRRALDRTVVVPPAQRRPRS